MATETAVQALWVVAALAALMGVWIYGVRPVINETARFQIFKVRDQLFDDYHNGKLACSPADYHKTRALLNGQIRYLHKLDGIHIALMLWSSSRGNRAIEAKPSIESEECRACVQRSVGYVIGGAMAKSPIILLAGYIALFVVLFAKGGPGRSLVGRLTSAIDTASVADSHRHAG